MPPITPKLKPSNPKHKEIIQAYKSLFLPTSQEWFETTYEEKKAELQERMKQEKLVHSPGFLLMNLTMDVIYGPSMDTKGNETDFEIPKQINPDIPIFLQILGPGLYLNKCIDPNYTFPKDKKSVLQIQSDLEELRDMRKKKYKLIQEIRAKKVRFFTRNFFDCMDSHSKEIPSEKKRETLRLIAGEGITPLELLFSHVLEYSEMQNYNHVVMEAPNSAFGLCS